MTDLSAVVDAKVAYEMRTHELKQAHELLVRARTLMRQAELHLEADGDKHADNVEAVVVNGLESVMWKIETEVRERKKAPR